MKELTTIQARLLALQDEAYRAFHKSLVPTLQQELIGVRVPQVRKLAKELAGTQESEAFLNELPHRFYEENLLHAIWLSAEKDFDRALSGIERFLPYVDNWAVCDAFSPKVFAKHPQEVLACIRRWLSSGRTYTIRFGVDMLMQFYLGDHFSPEQLRWAIRKMKFLLRIAAPLQNCMRILQRMNIVRFTPMRSLFTVSTR